VKLEAGRCLSCNDFCYGNSDICLQEEQVQYLKDKNASIMSQNDVRTYHISVGRCSCYFYFARSIHT
jgi:hypothetical protein